MDISKRIGLVTGLGLYHEQFASENYHILNYGIGGKISGHVDNKGPLYDDFYNDDEKKHSWLAIKFGGPRLMTFMIYLSSIEAGGHTVFPQPGISVKPEKGSALYWFNMGAQNNYDSRIYHLGCPVLYGNKWIANKWIKFVSNYHNY